MNAQECLEEALAYMESHGWHKGAFGVKEHGTSVCMLGSMGTATTEEELDVQNESTMFMVKAIKDYRGSSLLVPIFNDDENTTFDDVRHVMQQAAKYAAAEGR